MSTKSTIASGIASGARFHLYTDLLEERYIYLALEGVPFEASADRVVTPIPIAVWEFLRHFAAVDLRWADKEDSELARAVAAAVDERVARAARSGSGGGDGLRLAGFAVYGSPDDPREMQIASGVAYYTRLRARQRDVLAAIEELRRATTPRVDQPQERGDGKDSGDV